MGNLQLGYGVINNPTAITKGALSMTKYSEDMIIKARLKYLQEYYKLKEDNSKFDTVKELCEFFDISKKTLYKWRNRYEDSGEDPRSLLNRSTAPKTTPRKPPKWLERT